MLLTGTAVLVASWKGTHPFHKKNRFSTWRVVSLNASGCMIRWCLTNHGNVSTAVRVGRTHERNGNRLDLVWLRVRWCFARNVPSQIAACESSKRRDKGCRKGGDRADCHNGRAGPRPADLLGEKRL